MKAPGLRIGLVGPLPPPSGGMANQTRQLARLLGEEGVAVDVVQVNAPYRPGWVGGIKGLRAAFRMLPYLVRLWRVAGRVQLLHIMANSGWSWHLFAAPAVWIARLRGTPAIINYRGGEAETFFAGALRWVAPTLRQASAIVTPSTFLERVFRKHGFAARIVPNIIDFSRFSPRPTANGDPAAPHLLVARNLEPIYDIPTALRAFRIILARKPGATLSVAGSGPELAALQALAGELGIAAAVRFTGRVENDQMPSLYQSATLMLNPTLADNMPISLLESLASGVPVVSTNVGGIPDLVEDGRTALLVPPGQPDAMAQAALTLLDHPEIAERLAREGLAHVQQFAWSNVRTRLFDVYADAVGAPHACGAAQGE